LLAELTKLPKTPRKALELAKEIDKTLDTEAQLWLVDYLQHSYWQHQLTSIIQQLEQARKYLLGYAQPRLVWEVTLLELSQALNGGVEYGRSDRTTSFSNDTQNLRFVLQPA
jgi:DNA polymerase-3 subunit delta'